MLLLQGGDSIWRGFRISIVFFLPGTLPESFSATIALVWRGFRISISFFTQDITWVICRDYSLGKWIGRVAALGGGPASGPRLELAW